MTGAELVAEAREWIGTPFYHTGREKGIGCDCVGLLLGVAHALGLTDYDDRAYSEDVDPVQLRAEIERFCGPATNPIQDGDIGLFRIRGVAQHVGMFTAGGTLIHAYQSAGRVVEHAFDSHWFARLVAVYRWRGL